MMPVVWTLERARGGPLGLAGGLVAVCGVLARCRYDARLGARARRLADLLIVATLVAVGGVTALDAVSNIRWPRPWDFPSFYVPARAAAEGRAFYDPAVLTEVQREVARSAPVPAEWLHEVGYWYLPPSMLLVLPLGFLGFRAALALHYMIQGIFLVGAALLIHRATPLLPGRGGFAALLLVVLLFPPVQSSWMLAQIVPGALFFLALAIHRLGRSSVGPGLSLAAGFFAKHVLLIPAALMIVSRDRRMRVAGLVAVGGIAVALIASPLVFGAGIVHAWAANGPGARSPELAVDPVVQSLLALLYRGLGATPRGSLLHIILFPPFLAVAGLMTLATLAILARRAAAPPAQHLWLLASLALACYPNTLFSTLALLLPVIVGVAYAGLAGGVPFPIAAAFILANFAVAALAPHHAGWLSLMCWGASGALLLASPARYRERRAEAADSTLVGSSYQISTS